MTVQKFPYPYLTQDTAMKSDVGLLTH